VKTEIERFFYSYIDLTPEWNFLMKYTFLHISDLHYHQNWHEENGLVSDRFIDDIKNQVNNYENLYLIFSGDIVFKGESFELYSEFDKSFEQKLNEAGLPKNRRICVPGNHDISRDALKSLLAIQKGTLDQMTNEKLFNDHLPQNSLSFLASKFDNYKKHEIEFAEYTTCNSNLGGTGWELSNEIGVYCLNTALCSFAGLPDLEGKSISDQNKLMIDTRALHKWLGKTKSKIRILVMHHPLDWLTEWAKSELEKIISSSFQLIFSGHTHENSATFSTRGIGKSVHCVAPPLFTKKSESLGYSFVSLDTSNGSVEVDYRQWSSGTQKFVKGTGLAGDDSGKLVFASDSSNYLSKVSNNFVSSFRNTLAILQVEFDEATTCYSSMKRLWVDRDLANMPETSSDREGIVEITQDNLIKNFRSCVIKAPKQFGLTCLGRFLALEHHRQNIGSAIVMLDVTEIASHKQGVIKSVEARCAELGISNASISGLILDNWHSEKGTRKILRELSNEYKNLPIIRLESVDDCMQIANAIEIEDDEITEYLYLWALNRSRIRELVVKYLQDENTLDDNLVMKKIVEDIDALNIHRTPLNCLLILKLFEQSFDDSPVNRTEMIGRVLWLFFYQFNKIPKYATCPDLKDCESALGFFCEWLIRSEKKSFLKNDFFRKVQEYCSLTMLDLDIEFLFVFLATEHFFVKKGTELEFRFNYWLYFFAAHRMHHNSDFAEFILADRRYSNFPEIIEFYAGIDRRRSDAVNHLIEDLKNMNADFLKRTGIPEEFNPLKYALWTPNSASLEKIKQEVDRNMAESALPSVVKDAIADQSYNRAKPYNQDVINFINESSLIQMVQSMKGAARVLRNSDYVSPELKIMLLEQVLSCWVRVCQILAILSPILAHQRAAIFEGMGFFLDKSFDDYSQNEIREKIIIAIVDNVVGWYQYDLFSKKMGTLFSEYNRSNGSSLEELLVLLVMVRQRPPNWEKEVERFVIREQKNSFYLNKVFYALLYEYKTGFSTEKNLHELKRLAAMSLAKHETGSKIPNKQLIKKATVVLDDNDQKPEKNQSWLRLIFGKKKRK
jgi:predicted MPP superfamily phosphohydrolase